ncbi:transcriptional regulator TetR family [Nocardia nova SH22a]|uniref:Transcriptional regulator TetR family n=1 Tax=Nocardia nova SH22a TaxID=1415166 RepID=W5TEL9_9NOCA|nr:TetR/AcrR family transcriptional regulator [Nocardia nova]AHH17682.1 transcriptional regulator TetR family [Nocardia nova SH22a]
MPIEVDGSQRRRRIGDAGLRVVRAHGVAGLTVRAVAAELGGSTSLVTNYVRNRGELLALTMDSALRQWDTEAEQVTTSGGLAELAAWAVDWYSDDGPIVTSVLLEVLAGGDPDRLATVRRELDILYGQLRAATHDTDDPDIAADLLYLITRGAMVTSVEDPGRWPLERLTHAATYLVDRMRERPGAE